jgi:sugar lactone lactonase YvrE
MDAPSDVAVAPDGSVYIADSHNHRIRVVAADGIITTFAGDGSPGGLGDGGPATAAQLHYPNGVAVGADGSVYIADKDNHRIRKVDPAGIITTVAGNGTAGYSGDDGPATAASLNYPYDVAVGADGSIYIADWYNHCVRKVSPGGVITTVAGTGTPGYSGDGEPATGAQLNAPAGVTLGRDESLYIADEYNHRVRRVAPTGIISTVAGNGAHAYSGDGGPAAEASLNHPFSVALDADGTLYIADEYNHRIRTVAPTGIITTVVGNGSAGYSGDDGPATEASINYPQGIALGADCGLYIADRNNHAVRKLWPHAAYFAEPGWHLFSSGSECEIAIADCLVLCGSGEPIPFEHAANVCLQDPMVWYDTSLQVYRSCGLLPTDEDDHLRAFRGYWLYTFEPNLTLIMP